MPLKNEKRYIWFRTTKAKKSTVFQNKMIYVLYYLFNSFGLGENPLLFNKENPDQSQPDQSQPDQSQPDQLQSDQLKLPNQQQQNQNLRSWVTSVDDYTKPKKMLTNIAKAILHIVLLVNNLIAMKFND